jgi:hypothetical protein
MSWRTRETPRASDASPGQRDGLGLLACVLFCAALGLTTSPLLAAEPQDAARAFMLAIDSRYEELRPVPRRADMRIAGAIRTLGELDHHFVGTATVLQHDRRARFEMDTVMVDPAAESVADCRQTAAGHLTWVTDGTSLKIRYRPTARSAQPPGIDQTRSGQMGAAPDGASRSTQPEPIHSPPSPGAIMDGEPAAQEMRADFRRLPTDLGWRFRDPMGELELGREFLNHPFTLNDGVLDGRVVKVLRSVSDIPFSHTSRAHVILWIDPDTLLILRAVYDGTFVQSADGTEHAIEAEMNLTYRIGITLPETAFDLELAPDAKDITDVIAREGRAALGMLP